MSLKSKTIRKKKKKPQTDKVKEGVCVSGGSERDTLTHIYRDGGF